MTGTQPPPALPPNLAILYRSRVATLQQALATADNTDTLEAARALIEKVAIYPRESPDDPPQVDLEGNLLEMLKLAAAAAKPRSNENNPHPALATFVRSVKDKPGAEPPPCLPIPPEAALYRFHPNNPCRNQRGVPSSPRRNSQKRAPALSSTR